MKQLKKMACIDIRVSKSRLWPLENVIVEKSTLFEYCADRSGFKGLRGFHVIIEPAPLHQVKSF